MCVGKWERGTGRIDGFEYPTLDVVCKGMLKTWEYCRVVETS